MQLHSPLLNKKHVHPPTIASPQPSTTINHHQPSSTIINHHQPSSTIINHPNHHTRLRLPSCKAGVDVELRIVMHITTCELRQWTDGGQIHIGLRSQEKLHGDLRRRQLLRHRIEKAKKRWKSGIKPFWKHVSIYFFGGLLLS